MSRLSPVLKYRAYQILEFLFPKRVYSWRQEQWEKKWARDKFEPAWKISAVPSEIREAVESRWFPSGSSVLDIGCGSGEIAAWLAEQDFVVLGVDYSKEAIQKARRYHGDAGGKLSFRTVDILQEMPGTSQFDVLIDRGCLHGIPLPYVPDYVRTVAAAAKPGSRFLLLFGLSLHPDGETREMESLKREKLHFLASAFGPHFETSRVEETTLDRSSGAKPSGPVPGVALWMIRR